MSYQSPDLTGIDYFPCQYGNSKLIFRGPKRRIQDEFVAYLGGIETFGKFIEMPFPMLTEVETGMRSVNLGCVNSGVDAYINDKSLIDICSQAKVTVIQLSGAQNMSNRFYAVHPRRNDRVVRVSSLLRTIYDEVEFTEFNFTGHLLGTLAKASPEKFTMVENELRNAWVARMRSLIEQIGGKVVLLWMSDHSPDHKADGQHGRSEPLFIDRDMINSLAADVEAKLEIVGQPQEIERGYDEMIFGQMEQPAAAEMLGPVVHRRTAQELAETLQKFV